MIFLPLRLGDLNGTPLVGAFSDLASPTTIPELLAIPRHLCSLGGAEGWEGLGRDRLRETSIGCLRILLWLSLLSEWGFWLPGQEVGRELADCQDLLLRFHWELPSAESILFPICTWHFPKTNLAFLESSRGGSYRTRA